MVMTCEGSILISAAIFGAVTPENYVTTSRGLSQSTRPCTPPPPPPAAASTAQLRKYPLVREIERQQYCFPPIFSTFRHYRLQYSFHTEMAILFASFAEKTHRFIYFGSSYLLGRHATPKEKIITSRMKSYIINGFLNKNIWARCGVDGRKISGAELCNGHTTWPRRYY